MHCLKKWNQIGAAALLSGLALGFVACEAKQSPAPAPTETTTSSSPTASATPAAAGQVPAEATPTAATPTAGGLTAVAAKPVTMPAAAEGDEAGLVGYARLREPAKSVDRIGSWASSVNPMISSEMVRQQLMGMGLDVTKLRAGGNLSFVVLKPADAASKPAMAAVIPAAADSDVAKSISMMAQGSQLAAAGQDTLIGDDAASLEKVKPMAAQLSAINDHPLASDFQAYLNVGTLMELYGPMLRNYAAMAQGMMAGGAMGGAPGGPSAVQMQAIQQMLGIEMGAVFDALDQMKSTTFNFTFDPDALEISSVVTPKSGTAMASYFDAAPVQSPDLVQFVPQSSVMKVQMSIQNPKRLMDTYMKYMKQMLPPNSDEIAKTMQDLADQFAALGAVDIAYGLGFGDGGKTGMRVAGVAAMSDPAAYIKLVRDNAPKMKSMMDANKAMTGGLDYDFAVKPDARSVQGASVDQIVITFKFPEGMAPEQKAMLEKMWGGDTLTMEMMPLGKKLLYSMGKPIDDLAQQVASGSGSTTMAARQAYEPGASAYMDLDVAAYMTQVMEMVKETGAGAGINVPHIAGPPVTMAAYQQGGKGYYRLKIPKELIAAMKSAGEQSQPIGGIPTGEPSNPDKVDVKPGS